MKLGHWLGIIILLCIFTLIGTFSTVALVKQAIAQALDEFVDEN